MEGADKSQRKPLLSRVKGCSVFELHKNPDAMASINLKPSLTNSHVQEFITSKWDKEKAKTFQPYNDQKYSRVFSLPANEMSFLGGLGGKKGNSRSILHQSRPTEIQQIFSMRTSNRGLHMLTEDPRITNSYVAKRPSKINYNQEIKNIVDKVWMANNFEMKTKSAESDSTSEYRRRVSQKQTTTAAEPLPTQNIVNQVSERLDKLFKVPDELLVPRESFTDWAMRERARYKQKRAALLQQHCKTVTETLSLEETDMSDTWETGSTKVRRVRPRNVIKHVSGYMYGDFTKIPKPTKRTTKFGIPLSMIERAKEEQEEQKEKNRKLRRARITHMKLPIFFDEEESEKDDVMETVKRLSLIRTPFLRLPKIKTQKKRRRDRLRTKYLKQDRLDRITMLLFDRSYDSSQDLASDQIENSDQSDEEVIDTKTTDMTLLSSEHRKYIGFIREAYDEQIKDIEKEKSDALTSFEQFKETDKFDALRTKSTTPSEGIGLTSKPVIETLPVQKVKKNQKFSKSDEITGAFYIDPEQMEKMRDPTRFQKRFKYYTSLMRGKFDMRDRLQTTGIDFEDERCGYKEHSHRLATEFDNYYIHELRYRKPVRKFCPKSDILKLRNSVRQKFVDFYMKENLQYLVNKQAQEKKYLDDIEKFATICEPIFEKKKFMFYESMTNKIDSIAPAVEKTEALLKQRDSVILEREIINDKVIAIEVQFEHYLIFMEFYERLIPPEWKMDNEEKFKKYQSSLMFLSEFLDRLTSREVNVTTLNQDLKESTLQLLEPDSKVMHLGIHSIKYRIKGLLKELVQIMWIYDKILLESRRLASSFPLEENALNKNIIFENKKLSFVEERNHILKYEIKEIANKSLLRCVKNPVIRKISAICDQLYNAVIPKHLQNRHHKDEPVVEKFGFIQDYVLDLLHELDEIPIEIVKDAKNEVQMHTTFTMQQAKKTLIQQNRFELMKKQLKFHFTTKRPKSKRRRTPSPSATSPKIK